MELSVLFIARARYGTQMSTERTLADWRYSKAEVLRNNVLSSTSIADSVSNEKDDPRAASGILGNGPEGFRMGTNSIESGGDGAVVESFTRGRQSAES